MLAMHLSVYDKYQGCETFIAPVMIALLADTIVIVIATECIEQEVCQGCMTCILFLSIASYLILNPLALVLVIIILSHGRGKCIPQEVSNFDYIFVFCNNFFILLFFIIMMVMLCNYISQERKKARTEQELLQIYTRVLDPEFDLPAFLETNAEGIKALKFGDKDLALLRDQCGAKFVGNQEGVSEENLKECSICIGKFQEGDMTISHPGCAHMFHEECLFNWLIGDNHEPYCPNCKKPTRTELFNFLIQKRNINQFQRILSRSQNSTSFAES